MTDTDDLAEALRLLRVLANRALGPEAEKARYERLLRVLANRALGPEAEKARYEAQALVARHPEPVKIKPCPFCGGRGRVDKAPGGWVVECRKMPLSSSEKVCWARTSPWERPDDAIAAWNRRAP